MQGTKSRDSDNTFKSVWKRCQNTFTVMCGAEWELVGEVSVEAVPVKE